MVALSPWAILLIFTKGVLPIDNELSSKNFAINFSFRVYWNIGKSGKKLISIFNYPAFQYSNFPLFQQNFTIPSFHIYQFSGGLNLRSLNAFETTVTDEKAMAPAAKMGLRRIPKKGKSTPAATGMG